MNDWPSISYPALDTSQPMPETQICRISGKMDVNDIEPTDLANDVLALLPGSRIVSASTMTDLDSFEEYKRNYIEPSYDMVEFIYIEFKPTEHALAVLEYLRLSSLIQSTSETADPKNIKKHKERLAELERTIMELKGRD